MLGANTPVIVRMETLRRATIYGAKDQKIAYELLARLMARALNAESDGKTSAAAWFDAGYLVESLKQASFIYQWKMLEPRRQAGWAIKETRWKD